MPALGGLFSFKIPPPGGISYYIKKSMASNHALFLFLFIQRPDLQ